jgi:hypothetical protein
MWREIVVALIGRCFRDPTVKEGLIREVVPVWV